MVELSPLYHTDLNFAQEWQRLMRRWEIVCGDYAAMCSTMVAHLPSADSRIERCRLAVIGVKKEIDDLIALRSGVRPRHDFLRVALIGTKSRSLH